MSNICPELLLFHYFLCFFPVFIPLIHSSGGSAAEQTCRRTDVTVILMAQGSVPQLSVGGDDDYESAPARSERNSRLHFMFYWCRSLIFPPGAACMIYSWNGILANSALTEPISLYTTRYTYFKATSDGVCLYPFLLPVSVHF